MEEKFQVEATTGDDGMRAGRCDVWWGWEEVNINKWEGVLSSV